MLGNLECTENIFSILYASNYQLAENNSATPEFESHEHARRSHEVCFPHLMSVAAGGRSGIFEFRVSVLLK